MDYRDKFIVEPGAKLRLSKIDPSYTGKYESQEEVLPEIQKHMARLDKLQYLLFADGNKSLLVVLQALDAAGKDGVIRHVFSSMNPQGTFVFGFKQPSREEAAHDFLWRAHKRTPGKGEVVIFNRSYYEDVLVVRVHKLVPQSVWSKRFDLINGFETLLAREGTTVLKFLLHISPEEQLARFKQRLDDPSRNWKISENDYTERKLWPKYVDAYEDAIERDQHQACAVVRHPGQPQMVPQSRDLADHRRHHGRDGPEAAADPCRPRRHPAQISRRQARRESGRRRQQGRQEEQGRHQEEQGHQKVTAKPRSTPMPPWFFASLRNYQAAWLPGDCLAG